MLNLYATQIESLYIHKVGNKSRDERTLLSENPTILSDEMTPLFKEFFLKPFRDKEEVYFKFEGDDPEANLMCWWSDVFFKNTHSLNTFSEQIAIHLYDASAHPHIKAGEVYICHLKDIQYNHKRIDGIGIFKSEIKQDFLQFAKEDNQLEVILSQGVNLSKLDKGCIILNTQSDDGYRVLSVDNNRYDTKYWLDSFLGVIEAEDDRFYTKKYLKFCQDFTKDVVLPAEDKKEAVVFMNKAFNHLASVDEFNENNFINTFDNPDIGNAFKSYKQEFGPKYSIEDLTSFPVNNTAVKDSQKKFKSVINLDTNVSIKMGFVNQDSANKFIEKGWDEERQMYYYLVYFNAEVK